MSELHIPDLTIKGFRGIQELSIGSLGRVNLITGKNNTGKSSVLEALRLYAHNAAPVAIDSILAFREEYVRGADEDEGSADPESVFHVSALFHGFPRLTEQFASIVIETGGKSDLKKLDLHIDWYVEDRTSEGSIRLVPQKTTFLETTEAVPVLIVTTERRHRVYRLERLRNYARLRGDLEERRMPCRMVSPYGGQATNALGALLDDIALTPLERDAVEALRIIDPRIADVRMVGPDGPSRSRAAIVRANHIARPVPLRSFGDGVNHLFAIVLSLVNAAEGLLLIDEFENGLHHSVQLDAWRLIFRLAKELNVQVFATSHSKDAVEAFEEVARESPEEGIVVKLTRRGENLFATPFDEGQLTTIVGDQIEVR